MRSGPNFITIRMRDSRAFSGGHSLGFAHRIVCEMPRTVMHKLHFRAESCIYFFHHVCMFVYS